MRIGLLATAVMPLASGCVLMLQSWTEIPLSSIHETNLEQFKVAGYVVGVIECPEDAYCIVADGIVLSPEPVPERLVERPGNLETLGHDAPTRLGLEIGGRYMFFFKRRYGVVKAQELARG